MIWRRTGSQSRQVIKPSTAVGNWSLQPWRKLWDTVYSTHLSCPTQWARELGYLHTNSLLVIGQELFLAGVNSMAVFPAEVIGSMAFCRSEMQSWQWSLAGTHRNVRDMGRAWTDPARCINGGLVKYLITHPSSPGQCGTIFIDIEVLNYTLLSA